MSRVEKLAELTSIREQALAAAPAQARLAELLGDADAEVRAAAAAAVESHPDARDLVRRALRLAREDASADVRRAADLALGRVVREGDLAGVETPGYQPEPESYEPEAGLHAEVRDHLLATLKGGRTEGERLAAMEALGCLSARAEVVAAIEGAAAGGPASRAAALRAMGRSGDAARWRDAVLRGLGATEPEVALAAAWAAGELGLAEAAPRLAALLGAAATPGASSAAAVRAAEALGRIGGAEASRALLAAVDGAPDEDVQQAARDALEELEVLAGLEQS